MRFNHLAMIGGSSQREDKLTGLRASTEIPKFIGTAREYPDIVSRTCRTSPIL
jgi:hypothetical protein